MDRGVEYVIQVESNHPDFAWIDLEEHRARDIAEDVYEEAIANYGAYKKVRLVERVTIDTAIHRNFL